MTVVQPNCMKNLAPNRLKETINIGFDLYTLVTVTSEKDRKKQKIKYRIWSYTTNIVMMRW